MKISQIKLVQAIMRDLKRQKVIPKDGSGVSDKQFEKIVYAVAMIAHAFTGDESQ